MDPNYGQEKPTKTLANKTQARFDVANRDKNVWQTGKLVKTAFNLLSLL